MPFMNNNYLLPNFLHFAMLLSAAALRGAYASVRVPPTRSAQERISEAHIDGWRTMWMRNLMMMVDDGDAQSDDGGEVAYLRHAEVGVEENPGTLRCALRTGLRKSAVALRRESANRGMTFIQPLFGGSRACIGVTG